MNKGIVFFVFFLLILGCEKEEIVETEISGDIVNFYTNEPIESGYIGLYQISPDPSDPLLVQPEPFKNKIDSIKIQEGGIFHYYSTELKKNWKYQVGLKNNEMITIDTVLITGGINKNIKLKTKKIQTLKIGFNNLSHNYDEFFLLLNRDLNDCQNGIPIYSCGKAPYSHGYRIQGLVDTILHAEILPDFPYKISLQYYLNRELQKEHKEDTIFSLNENKEIFISINE